MRHGVHLARKGCGEVSPGDSPDQSLGGRSGEQACACVAVRQGRNRPFPGCCQGLWGYGSDVDLLVSFDGPADWHSFFGVRVCIEDLFGRRVDLVTKNSLLEEIRPYDNAEAVGACHPSDAAELAERLCSQSESAAMTGVHPGGGATYSGHSALTG